MDFKNIYTEVVCFKNLDDDNNKLEYDCHGCRVNKDNRSCIFCRKDAPEVHFSHKAHAVSEMLGNKVLFSHFECDSCNKAFGSIFEDALGKYLLPLKFISGCFGKKNTITIKDMPEDSSEISYGTFRMERKKNADEMPSQKYPPDYLITSQDGYQLTRNEDGFTLHIKREKYNPRLVYAALLKMAYGVIPLNKLEKYAYGIACLTLFARREVPFDNADESQKFLASLPNVGLLAVYPGINPLHGVSIHLYERGGDKLKYPSLLFQVDFYNFSITIPVLEDNQPKSFTLLSPYSEVEAEVQRLDFTQVEDEFSCGFLAQRVEIDPSEYGELADLLREKKLLRSPVKTDGSKVEKS